MPRAPCTFAKRRSFYRMGTATIEGAWSLSFQTLGRNQHREDALGVLNQDGTVGVVEMSVLNQPAARRR